MIAFSDVATAVQGTWQGWWKALAGAALVVAPAFLVGRCSVDTEQACAGQQVQASVTALRVDRAADTAAAVTRQADAQTIAAQSQAVKDATHALPDQAPTARQHARACSLLSQQGATADVLRTAGC